ncbi:hypothetical protein PMPD1_3090 [Paramixta manurensis]|uniref:Uncharacterized protein n=1 Tax=Paramixta manurensis TaxID=2740817 RepID=A0A6M8USH5_9GAMM|nr:hypothetical protein PMPD1_3090 [Erwiniaceae bacterium PD-1]
MGGVAKAVRKVHSVVSTLDPAIKFGDKALTKAGLPTVDSLTAEPDEPDLTQTATTVMPTEDTDAVTAARRRKTADQMQRSGRASTILTDRLGG